MIARLRAWARRVLRREPEVTATVVLDKDWDDMTEAERDALIDKLTTQLYPDEDE